MCKTFSTSPNSVLGASAVAHVRVAWTSAVGQLVVDDLAMLSREGGGPFAEILILGDIIVTEKRDMVERRSAQRKCKITVNRWKGSGDRRHRVSSFEDDIVD
jgi:hypothetical protein